MIVVSRVVGQDQLRSADRVYTLCTQVANNGNGSIWSASESGSCEDDNRILKCGGRKRRDFILAEYAMMQRVDSVPWTPTIIEVVSDHGSHKPPCIAMERLGQSLTDIRNSQQGKWSWVTVASIGIRTLDIMEVLHKQLGVVHSDPHPGNWVLERDSGLSPHVRLIDFGDAKDVGFPGIAKLHLEDVQQLVYSLRYFYDGNMDYYAYKRAVPMDPSDLPAPYMHAFRYVCSLTDPSHIDYKQIRDYLVSIMQQFGASYRGGITWSPDGISHPFPPQNVKQRAPLIQKQVQPALSDFDKPSLAAETPSVASAVILLAITLLVFL